MDRAVDKHDSLRQIAHVIRTVILPTTAPWRCGDFLALAEAFWPEFCPRMVMKPMMIDVECSGCATILTGFNQNAKHGFFDLRERARIRAICGMRAEYIAASRGALTCTDWLREEYHNACFAGEGCVRASLGDSFIHAIRTCSFAGVIWFADHFNGTFQRPMLLESLTAAENVYELLPSYSASQREMRKCVLARFLTSTDFVVRTFRAAQYRQPPDLDIMEVIDTRLLDAHCFAEYTSNFLRACRIQSAPLIEYLARGAPQFRSRLLKAICHEPHHLEAVRTLVVAWQGSNNVKIDKTRLLSALRFCWDRDDADCVKLLMDAGKFDDVDALELLYRDRHRMTRITARKARIRLRVFLKFPAASNAFNHMIQEKLDKWLAGVSSPGKKKRKTETRV